MRMLAQPGTPQAGPPKMPGVINPMYSQAPQQQQPAQQQPAPQQQNPPPGVYYSQAQQPQPQTQQQFAPQVRQALTQPQPQTMYQQAPQPQQPIYSIQPQAPFDPLKEGFVGRGGKPGQWVGPNGNPVWVESHPGERDYAAEQRQKEAAHQAWVASRGNGQQQVASQAPAVTPDSIRTSLTAPAGGDRPGQGGIPSDAVFREPVLDGRGMDVSGWPVLKAPGSPGDTPAQQPGARPEDSWSAEEWQRRATEGAPKSREQQIFERRMELRNAGQSDIEKEGRAGRGVGAQMGGSTYGGNTQRAADLYSKQNPGSTGAMFGQMGAWLGRRRAANPGATKPQVGPAKPSYKYTDAEYMGMAKRAIGHHASPQKLRDKIQSIKASEDRMAGRPVSNRDMMRQNMGWAPATEDEARGYMSGYQRQADQHKAMAGGDYSGASSQAGWYQTKPGMTQYMPNGLAGHIQQQKKQGGNDFMQSLLKGLMG